jgi:Flp pilus assembly protein CpaB
MAAASIPVEPSRALRATRQVHRGLVLGALLTAVAVAGSYSLYQTRSATERSVVVATHDIPRGAILSANDFTTRSTPLDDGLYSALLHPGQTAALVGQAAPEDLHAGLPIGASQVAPREDVAPDQIVASLPVSPNTVPLRKGDWIQVWASPKNSGHTSLVLAHVQVLEVRTDGSSRTAGGVGQDRAPQIVAVDLALQPAQAQALLEARHTGDVDVTRLPATAIQAGALGASSSVEASP